jgi:hypothetical protein
LYFLHIQKSRANDWISCVILSTTTTKTTTQQQHCDDNHHHQLFLTGWLIILQQSLFHSSCIHSLVPCSPFDTHPHLVTSNWVDNHPTTKPFPFFCIHLLVPCSPFDTPPHLVTSHCPWSPQLTLNIIFNAFKGKWLPSVCNACLYQCVLYLTNFPFSVSIFRSCLMPSLLSFLISSVDYLDQIFIFRAFLRNRTLLIKSVLFIILTCTDICAGDTSCIVHQRWCFAIAICSFLSKADT